MKGKQILSLLLSAALVCSLLTGCQQEQEKTAEVSTPPGAVTEPEPEQKSVPSPSQGDGADKEETVYVQAEADGSPKKVTVEVRVRHTGDGKPIQDISNLTDIRNTKGDEEYTQEADALLWDNHGADISYKGESSQPLPVRVKLSATLDGKNLPPEQLAGRSGHLILRFDYENLTGETVTVQAKQKDKKGKKEEEKSKPKSKEFTVKVPFVAMTALFLSDEVFSNVKVTNGECMKTDEQTMVLGYACPGLEESLRLADFEATEEIDVPEYVEVEADVTDFALDFTATVLTPELAGKLETDSLDDLDELAQGMDELADASDKLSDATGGLHKGLKQFQSYLRKYTKAVHTVRQGSEKLRKGLKTLNSHTEKLQAQMEEMEKNLPDHDAQQAGEKTPAELLREAQTALSKVSSFTKGVESYCQAVEGGKGSAIASLGGIDWSGMEEAAAAAIAYAEGVEQLSEGAGTMTDALKEMDKAGRKLNKAVSRGVKGAKKLAKAMKEFDEEGIEELNGQDVEELALRLRAVRQAGKGYQSFTGLPDACSGSVRFIIETEEIRE